MLKQILMEFKFHGLALMVDLLATASTTRMTKKFRVHWSKDSVIPTRTSLMFSQFIPPSRQSFTGHSDRARLTSHASRFQLELSNFITKKNQFLFLWLSERKALATKILKIDKKINSWTSFYVCWKRLVLFHWYLRRFSWFLTVN